MSREIWIEFVMFAVLAITAENFNGLSAYQISSDIRIILEVFTELTVDSFSEALRASTIIPMY
jgi:hypothetical protein